jgi:hypothetical protein
MTFRCEICGKDHAEPLTDKAFTLPDEVWAIPEEGRKAKAKYTQDLCQFGNRYFIRCLLPIPFTEREGAFGWGVWLEVDWPTFERYLKIYAQDATNEAPGSGVLANEIPIYENSIGLPAIMRFGTASQRPTVWFSEEERHACANEQRAGIDTRRYHEIIDALSVKKH